MKKQSYKTPDVHSGNLRTPVTFYEYAPAEGPDPGQQEKKILYQCYAQVYAPSMKDLEIMRATGTKEAVTIRIRDPGKEYIPTNKHFAEMDDYRYTGRRFDVVDVAYDVEKNRIVKMLLGYTS